MRHLLLSLASSIFLSHFWYMTKAASHQSGACMLPKVHASTRQPDFL